MPLSGTLATFGDEESWKTRYQQEVVKVLETGGGDVFGVPIPLPLPMPEVGAAQSEAVQEKINNGDPFPILTGGFYASVEAIDTILPPGPNNPIGFTDPTKPIEPIIPEFLNLLFDIGINDPIPWFLENIEAISDLPWDKLSQCENEEFAQGLSEIDDRINTNGLPEKLKAICGLSVPDISLEFPPQIDFPSFDFDFAIDIDLPTLDPFLSLNLEFPALNWVPIQIMLGIIDALIALISKIGELILELLKGIVNFLLAVIEIVINIVLEAIALILEVLKGAILFVACIIAMIKLVIIAFITAFVGFMVDKGLISFGTGSLLGLE
jgi:hypothetical protein